MAGRVELPRLELRALRPAERRLAAGLTARAMRDNPTTEAMFGPEPLERLAGMQAIWTAFFHRLPGLALGGFYRGCLVAVAAAVPPGGCVGAARSGGAAAVVAGREPPPGDPARTGYVHATYAVHDLADPHWHVGPVVVEPGCQARGIGEALMRALQRHPDIGPGALWGETDTVANVRFYQRLGWRPVRVVRLLGIRLWFLHRPPGQAATGSGSSDRSSANGSNPSATRPISSSASGGE
jgi:GNAT superfamily N-acetyltransferase